RVYTFLLGGRILAGGATLVMTSDGYGEIKRRTLDGAGDFICALQTRVERRGWYRLSLVAGGGATRAALEDLRLEVRSAELPAVAPAQPPSLPHWRSWQSLVHALCRRSRLANSIVAAFEFHAGSEEVLSLPQYMALCPTGQCNASCDFCSVTIR